MLSDKAMGENAQTMHSALRQPLCIPRAAQDPHPQEP